VAGTQTYPLVAVDSTFNDPVESLSASVETNSLSPGRHTIFVESQDADGNWGVSSGIFLWITAEDFQPEFSPNELEGSGSPDSSVIYSMQLINLGTQDDIFDLQVTGNNWDMTFPLDPIGPLAPMGTIRLFLQVTIPETAQIGDQDTAILKSISQGNPTKFSLSQIKTTVRNPEIYLPTIAK